MRHQNRSLSLALGQINASCPKEISGETLIACVKGEINDARWQALMVSFLEELPVELIHDIVRSGVFTFQELLDAIAAWGCDEGPTTQWIREMAGLGVETAS